MITLTLVCGILGCSQAEHRNEFGVMTSLPAGTRIAVAPALNFSGSQAFDPVKIADLMASELSEIKGLGVIGVNRVLAVLAEQGLERIQSPQHALDICDRVGADVMLVFAITEYNAYTPIVGIAAQIYGKQPARPALDPVTASRMARPFPVAPQENGTRPWRQAQRTFHGTHEAVQSEVRRYAKHRGAQDSPYGWRKYLASQEWYMRYCCYSIAIEMVAQQLQSEAVADATGKKEFGS